MLAVCLATDSSSVIRCLMPSACGRAVRAPVWCLVPSPHSSMLRRALNPWRSQHKPVHIMKVGLKHYTMGPAAREAGSPAAAPGRRIHAAVISAKDGDRRS